VVVAPLAISAGTNIKVLEALACGKALVTTPVGGQGLNLRDGHDALIREDWDCFAQAVYDLLIDDQFACSLGMRARRTAEAQFSWRKIAHQAYTSYIEVAASGRTTAAISSSAGAAREAVKDMRASVHFTEVRTPQPPAVRGPTRLHATRASDPQ
jgi:hypothetical protein